jgi:hypothetical protein
MHLSNQPTLDVLTDKEINMMNREDEFNPMVRLQGVLDQIEP